MEKKRKAEEKRARRQAKALAPKPALDQVEDQDLDLEPGEQAEDDNEQLEEDTGTEVT